MDARETEQIATRIQYVPTSATASPSCSAPVGLSAQAMFEKLEKLIAWRSSGHLSDAEFIAAKRALGLG